MGSTLLVGDVEAIPITRLYSVSGTDSPVISVVIVTMGAASRRQSDEKREERRFRFASVSEAILFQGKIDEIHRKIVGNMLDQLKA
jgi:hypothetical protein